MINYKKYDRVLNTQTDTIHTIDEIEVVDELTIVYTEDGNCFPEYMIRHVSKKDEYKRIEDFVCELFDKICDEEKAKLEFEKLYQEELKKIKSKKKNKFWFF